MLFDTKAWIDGDLEATLQSIDTIDRLQECCQLLQAADRPKLKSNLLDRLKDKFRDIPAPIWVTLITQDNNIEIFKRHWQNSLKNNTTLNILESASACSWFLVSVSQRNQNPNYNSNNLRLFEAAVNYCIYFPPNRCFHQLLKIWKAPLLYRFTVLEKVCRVLNQDHLAVLYPLEAINNVVRAQLEPDLTPLIHPIIANFERLTWSVQNQITLINQNAMLSARALEVTMSSFTVRQQHQVWRALNFDKSIYYHQLKWSQIDSRVVPYSEDVAHLFDLLCQRKRSYGYDNQILEYCLLNHAQSLKRALNCKILNLDQIQPETIVHLKHAKVIVRYWLNNLPESRSDCGLILRLLNSSFKDPLKIMLLDQIGVLIGTFDGDSQIFRIVLEPPLPNNYTVPKIVAQHVFRHIPSLISVRLYRYYRDTVISMLKEQGPIVLPPNVFLSLLNDILGEIVDLDQELVAALPIPSWQCLSLTSYDRSTLIGKLQDLEQTTHVGQILSELCYSGNLSKQLPSALCYNQYIVEHYGINQLTLTQFLGRKPIKLVLQVGKLTVRPLNWTLFYRLYEHYQLHDQLKLLQIEHSFLVHMINDQAGYEQAHQIFFRHCQQPYRLENSALDQFTDDQLQDHSYFGKLTINRGNYQYFTNLQLKMINKVCMHCGCTVSNPLDQEQLPCGHLVHVRCRDNWLELTSHQTTNAGMSMCSCEG